MSAAPRGVEDWVIPAPTGSLAVPPAGPPPRPLLSLVITTLNEAENIAEFLGEVRRTLDQALPGRYEIVVVDDDSPDRTWEVAARLTSGFP